MFSRAGMACISAWNRLEKLRSSSEMPSCPSLGHHCGTPCMRTPPDVVQGRRREVLTPCPVNRALVVF